MKRLTLALCLILLSCSFAYAEAPYKKNFNDLFKRCMTVVANLKKTPSDNGFSEAFTCAETCKVIADEGRVNYINYGENTVTGRLGLWKMAKYEPLRATVLLSIAEAYANKGDKLKAKGIYRQVVIEFDPERHRAAVKKAEFALEDLK